MTSGLSICSYNPHKNTISTYIETVSKSLDSLSPDYEKMILLGDFNVEVNDHQIKSFCENYGLKNLIKHPTFYKSPSNPTYTDLEVFKLHVL